MSVQLVINSPRLRLVAGSTNRLTLQLTPTPRVSIQVGFRGPEGAPGLSSTQQYIADEPISALRVLAPTTYGHVQYADPTDITPVGISVTAAAVGDLVTIAGTDKVVTDSSWSWTPDAPVFCGANGSLTQTVPTSGTLLVVGIANSATQIVVRFSQPITLA